MITSRMMEWAADRHLCRIVIVNRIDAENVDLPGVLAAIRAAFGNECLPINLPADGGRRVVDCFFNPSGTADFSSVAEAHQALVDQVIEVDEELMAKYLEQGESIEAEQLHAPFEKALREGHLVPVCFVSARTGAGVAELLEVLVKLAPNPTEGNPPMFTKGDGATAVEFRSVPDPTKHALAHVFKVVVDPFVGKLGVFRVHQGTVTKDTQLYVGESKKPFKVGHLLMLQGAKHVEIDRAFPGDIAAVAKVDEVVFDCVLHDSHDEDRIHMVPLSFPTPMHGLAIEPKRRGDEQRLSEVLHKMCAEDPTLAVEHDATLNETVLRGWASCTCARRSSAWRASSSSRSRRGRRASPTARRSPARPRATTAQEADRRRRAVRRGLPAHRAAAARRRVRVRRRGEGRHDPDAVPARGAEGRRAGPRHRPRRGLSAAGRARDRVRRQEPRGRLEGGRVRVGGQEGVHRRDLEGAADRARADRQPRGALPGRQDGRHRRRPGVAPGAGDRHADARGRRARRDRLGTARELEGYGSRLKAFTGGHGSYTMALARYEQAPPTVQQALAAEYAKHRKHEED